jgi:uncharacterized protein (DUF305 family)
MQHIGIMTLSMVLAGFMSTMNTWSPNWEDVYFSLNDVYMVGIMTGFMFFFMGLFLLQWKEAVVGGLVGLFFIMAARNQWWVGQNQYLRQMIPHHGMAVFLSQKLSQKPNTIQPYLDNIITNQSAEIRYMKCVLSGNEDPCETTRISI